MSDVLEAEVAHVLFLDLVGYSRMSMEDQDRSQRELIQLVRNTPQLQRTDERSERIVRPSGDGLALLFFRDPLAPVQCAAEIARALRSHPRLRLRIGIHSGPITRVPDINNNQDVSGAGIVYAQRVMDCGDAGHILLSSSAADMVRPFEAWSNCLVDLGEIAVKHGTRLRLFNLVMGEIGNADMPSKVAGVTAPTPEPLAVPTPKFADLPQPEPVLPLRTREEAGASPTVRQVAFVYKRKSPLDEHLIGVLENALTAGGFETFIDRHLHVGLAWAAEIERRLREADAVIILLSEAANRSDMVEWEVQTAAQAADIHPEKRPRLLPVRVAFEGTLSEALTPVLGSLQYTLWAGPQDDANVARAVIDALTTRSKPTVEPSRRERAGGAVPLDSAYYVERPADGALHEAIARRDPTILLKGGRQVGKTSLLARGLQRAREAGAGVVFTDLQALAASDLESPQTLLMTFAGMIADQLDLDVLPEEVWSEKRSANINMERYLRKEVLGALEDRSLVWGIDEADRLFPCPFGSEIFALFRSWHNKRAMDPTGPWSRLTLTISYATEAHLFITDLNQSPFNVGTKIILDDFTLPQVAELNRRYGEPLVPTTLARYHDLNGGQPYLVRRGLDELASGLSYDAFERQALRDGGPYSDHLRRILLSLTQDRQLTEGVRAVLHGEGTTLTPEVFYRLRAAGLVCGDSVRDTHMRCRLYTEYLSQHLL